MKNLVLLALCLFLVTGLAAQTKYFVCPSKYTTPGTGTYYHYYLFSSSYNTYHSQMVYDVDKNTPAAAKISGCAFRRMSKYSNENFPMTADVEVWMSAGPNTGGTASTTFATNRGTNYIQVLPKTNISLPGAKHTTKPDFVVKIPFKTPFSFATGSSVKSIVPEFWVSNSKATPPATTTTWWMDGFTKESGPFTYNGSSQPSTCQYSNGKTPTTGGYILADLYPGGAFYYGRYGTYASSPGDLSGICILGTMGNGQTWLGLKLPLDLSFLEAGTKCELRVSIDLSLPFKTESAGGWRWPSVSIPNNPSVIGAVIYEQAIILDPTKTNPLHLVPTMSMKWGPVGSGKLEGGLEVYKSKDTTPPATTGTVRDRMPIIQFSY